MRHKIKFLTSLIGIFAILMAHGCACRTAEKKNTPGCAFVNNMIDCTTSEVQSLIPKILPLVAFLLSGANSDPNWEEYLIGLESLGLGAVACTAEVAMNDLVAKTMKLDDPSNGMMAKNLTRQLDAQDSLKNWQKWKVERVGKEVKFKTK